LATAHVLSQSRKPLKQTQLQDGGATSYAGGELPPMGDVKQVNVKTANKSIRTMRAPKTRQPGGGYNDEDSDEMVLDNILMDIIGQVLANKMEKKDPEYKNFKESYDRVVPYFTDRIQHIADHVVYAVFQEMNDRQPEFVNVLQRNMLDTCELIRFFAKCFRKVNPVTTVNLNEHQTMQDTEKSSVATSGSKNIFSLMVETLSQIGNKLLNSDPLQTEVFFLEYGADELLDIMCENQFKRNEMVVLLYCFI